MYEFYFALLLILPVFIAGSLHMFIVAHNLFHALKVPIYRSKLGKNKTWRGVIMMPILSAVSLPLVVQFSLYLPKDYSLDPYFAIPVWVAGILLGLFYIVFELPNSYIKRQLAIPEGKTVNGWRSIFIFFDQADSALGCVILYALVTSISLNILIICFAFGSLIHLFANSLLFIVGLRKEPI
ncbi:MAG: CDP-archaeol synthase [Candidatus Thiodiazotropha sp.]